MAPENFVIGKDCRIGEVVICLKSSPSFHMFHDMIAEFALELDTRRLMVKKLKDDYRQGMVNLTDVVHNLIDEWVTRNANNATLQALIRALNEIGLKDCSELLKNKLTVVGGIDGAPAEVKRYDRVPPSLQQFLIGNSNFCIVHTLDCELTCEKLCENWNNCIIHDWKSFVVLASSSLKRDKETVNIVKNCTLNNLKQLKKARGEAYLKVVFVTDENEQSVKEVVRKLASWKDKVEICADRMDWEDQEELMERLKEWYKMDFEELELNGKVLADVINGNMVKLFKDTLPKGLSYYVDRRVLTRCMISFDIFQQNSSDIFLFTGMERYELTNRASNALTDISSNQIRQSRLTVRYMILDQPSHFGKIFARACAPVHLLHHENGKLRWIRSRGGMGKIHDFIDKSQIEKAEEEFCQIVSIESKEAICISDSPGMGKSVLLAQIGRRLERNYPERLVFFIIISELINQIKESRVDDKVKATELALKLIVCEDVIGEVVLSSKLRPQVENETTVELLLDGFDEVASTDELLAYEILHIIRSSFKSLRMWITSRPHLLRGLENHLGILGYSIQPFEEQDQIHFLTLFWSRNPSVDVDTPRIRQFAQRCLNSLKNKMNTKDQDIAGVPLQCLLIGEVYEEDALEYSRLESGASSPVDIDAGTMANLYQLLLEQKFKKCVRLCGGANVNERATMEMHARLSLELIFPEQSPKLQHMLQQTELEHVLKVGIVESMEKTNLNSTRFIHRTFAEYLIAWFVVDRMVSEDGWNASLTNFLVDNLLRPGGGRAWLSHYYDTHVTARTAGDPRFERFNFPTIIYFIDAAIADKIQDIPIPVTRSLLEKVYPSETTMKKIVYGCVLHDFAHIMIFFNEIKAFDQHASTIFSDKVLFFSTEKSGLPLVKIVLGYFPEPRTLAYATQVNILRAVARRGEYSILEFFIKEKGFREIVENPKKRTKAALVLHDCVQFTDKYNNSEIAQRIQIMHMLVGINRQLLEICGGDQPTPLLSNRVHSRLLLELIRLGANIFAKDRKYGRTILHNLDFISSKSFNRNSILKNIPEDKLRKLVGETTTAMQTPLMFTVQGMDPLQESINIFQRAGADFNCVDAYGQSILAVAIRKGRTVVTLQNLIKHGSDVNWQDYAGYTHLHRAAKYGKLDAIKLLVDEYNLNVNAKTRTGYSPMDCVIKGQDYTGRRFDTALFLKAHGGQFNESANSQGQSLLHLAGKEGNMESVRLLLHFNLNVNAEDNQGNTPLHYAHGLSVTQLLLENNANPRAVNRLGETPLHTALKSAFSDFKTLHLLKCKLDGKWSASLAHLWLLAILKEDPETVDDQFHSFAEECAADGVRLGWNYRNSNGETLLHLVASQCIFPGIHFFAEDRALSEFIKLGSTPDSTELHHGAMTRLGAAILFLIEKGVDVSAKDNQNRTFAHIYIQNMGCSKKFLIRELLEYLVMNGHTGIFEIKGGVEETTPLQLAIRWGILAEGRMMKLLQKNDVNFNVLDKFGRNVLSYAILGYQEGKTISSLIECGADYRVIDKDGCNLLHISAQTGNIDSLKILLGFGELEVNGIDKDGNTPLHYAVVKVMHVKELCGMLVENGGDTDMKNNNGDTPLALALKKWWHTNDFKLHGILGAHLEMQKKETNTF